MVVVRTIGTRLPTLSLFVQVYDGHHGVDKHLSWLFSLFLYFTPLLLCLLGLDGTELSSNVASSPMIGVVSCNTTNEA